MKEAWNMEIEEQLTRDYVNQKEYYTCRGDGLPMWVSYHVTFRMRLHSV